METANYNHEAGNEGWIYDWVDKNILSNEEIMTLEQLKDIQTQMPSLKVFKNITPQITESKNNFENHIESLIQAKTQNYGRSM